MNLFPLFIFFFINFFLTNCKINKIVPISIATIVVGDNPLYGYSTNSAAYDVAFDRAREIYPKIFQDFSAMTFHQPGQFSTCGEAAGEILVLLSSLYNTTNAYGEDMNRVWIILSPGCSLEIFQLGDIGREMDNPVIASTATDHSLSDESRYPTVLATGPSGRYSLVQTTLELLKLYHWERVSVIGDEMSKDPTFSSVLSLYHSFVLRYLSSRSSGLNTLVQNVDSTISMTFDDELKTAASHSSIILLISIDPEVYVRILTLATSLRMNNGNFVFFIIQFNLAVPQSNPFGREGISKNKLQFILPFVFEITTPPMNLTTFQTDWEKIENRFREYGPQTIRHVNFNESQLSAYESTLMLAEVLNETYDELAGISAREFIDKFRNRTFNLPTGKVTIAEDRSRVATTIVKLYKETEQEFKTIWQFSAGNLLLVDPHLNWEIQWKGKTFPPSALPFCTRANKECFSGETHDDPFNNNYLLLLILITGPVYAAFRLWKKVEKKSEWWNVDHTNIDFDYEKNSEFCSFLLGGKTVNLECVNGREIVYQHGLYKGHVIQILGITTPISFTDVLKNKNLITLLQQIGNLDHPNIGRFYGISFIPTSKSTQKQISTIYENPKKGLLRAFIENDDLQFNWDLRASLIWDIIRALRYIHESPLRLHGALSFLNLMIDEHFTLKVAQTGAFQLLEKLKNDQKIKNSIPFFAKLWIAPESLDENDEIKSVSNDSSSSADIFSLGVILYEISSRNSPFEVDVSNLEEIKKKLQEIRSGQLDVAAYPVPSDTPVEMMQLAKKCWSFEPADRPTIAEIADTLIALRPNSDISVAESILRRLEQYNHELETTVRLRKEALQVEKNKVDALLSNLLPKSIVQQLRNGETLVPEFFSSVTVLFSDIPAFNDMVEKCTPFSIVDLLHRLYSKMDEVIAQNDVYKVETIKDSYMVASGLPGRNGDRHAAEIAEVALTILETSSTIISPVEYGYQNLKLRIGINTGSCVAAVIGQKLPHYCLVGDTVNTASRMETQGEELKIHLTDTTKNLLDKTKLFHTVERGQIWIKGKGEMTTYWLISKLERTPIKSAD